MVERSLVKMMKLQRTQEKPLREDMQITTLEMDSVHYFRLKRTTAGNYTITFSEGVIADELGFHFMGSGEMATGQPAEQLKPYFEKAFGGVPCFYRTGNAKRTLYTSLTPVFSNGKVIEVAGATADYSGNNYPVAEQRESSQKYKEIFNHSIHPTLLLDDNRVILDANPAARRLLGISPYDVERSRIDAFIVGEPGFDVTLNWDLFLLDPAYRWEFNRGTAHNKRLIEFTGKKDILPGIHLGILQDVTERRQTQERLRKAETLNVVGEMAAGVAHEIRNPLTSLKGFVQLMQNEGQAHEVYYSIILNEVDRIDHIIKEFLLLAKTDRQEVQKISLVNTLKETVSLLETQAILKNITLDLVCEEDLPDSHCDPFQMKQVFINLIKNAIEASNAGGKISITAKRKDSKYIHFTFTDNGTGMPNKVLNRIGKPFYTTKEDGTGLGLMVSYKIIENHKGTVNVSSEVGKGTTFEISLPLSP
ncbi:PAS domain S-box-containing protein [Fictibacillus enclensis]|uniref:histidine kinase n=1 Tax=Fictibacillus enclensis TaxID=1017270 RepID=A0A0V8JBB7_9BACL|nr:ATP-binding protein [Fictibacillus enclensis]KSU84156.1 hypothetical protein AS030_00885 [Fictibacillus enclensis]SCB74052.1 PAS domain S-box-containing protein [Fictibacillus enclensis]